MFVPATLNETRRRYYERWRSIISRCYNPNIKNYQYYGAKGVGVCWEWSKDNALGSVNFMEWLEAEVDKWPDSSVQFNISRRDKTKDYGPENCFLATMSKVIQARDMTALSEKIVVDIRQFAKKHKHLNACRVAAYFKLPASTVYQAALGLTWSSLDEREPPVSKDHWASFRTTEKVGQKRKRK